MQSQYLAEWEKKKQAEAGSREDSVAMRQRLADKEKQRKLQELAVLNQKQKDAAGMGSSQEQLKKRHMDAELEKQRKLKQLVEVGTALTSSLAGQSA